MLRLITGLTIGMILGFQAPRYAQRCREMCKKWFEHFHSEAHGDGKE